MNLGNCQLPWPLRMAIGHCQWPSPTQLGTNICQVTVSGLGRARRRVSMTNEAIGHDHWQLPMAMVIAYNHWPRPVAIAHSSRHRYWQATDNGLGRKLWRVARTIEVIDHDHWQLQMAMAIASGHWPWPVVITNPSGHQHWQVTDSGLGRKLWRVAMTIEVIDHDHWQLPMAMAIARGHWP